MDSYETQSDFLKALSHPTRLAILDILREGEQCVCHMEATLGLRQAYISQQLMILKNAGLVESRRDGLNLYYRVTKSEIFTILDTASTVTGIAIKLPVHKHANTECPCPKCSAKTSGELLQAAQA
ncbi:MAG: metalloregulator ArsR/SmtB family transcription factor [Anaerolineales bacterium]